MHNLSFVFTDNNNYIRNQKNKLESTDKNIQTQRTVGTNKRTQIVKSVKQHARPYASASGEDKCERYAVSKSEAYLQGSFRNTCATHNIHQMAQTEKDG